MHACVCVYLSVSVVMLIKTKTKSNFSKVVTFYLTNLTNSKLKGFSKSKTKSVL